MFSLHTHDALHEVAHGVGIKHVFSKTDGMGDHVFKAMTALLAAAA